MPSIAETCEEPTSGVGVGVAVGIGVDVTVGIGVDVPVWVGVPIAIPVGNGDNAPPSPEHPEIIATMRMPKAMRGIAILRNIVSPLPDGDDDIIVAFSMPKRNSALQTSQMRNLQKERVALKCFSDAGARTFP